MFAQLHPLLTRHAESLVVVRDEPGDLWLDARRSNTSGTRLTFGALKTQATSVSLLFMPVASHADLLDELSDELRALMVGRSAFAFTPETTTPQIVDELSALVDTALDRYRADKLT